MSADTPFTKENLDACLKELGKIGVLSYDGLRENIQKGQAR